MMNNYNTQRDHLLLPEYGRMVQEMIKYALQLPEKEARQRCAEAIIDIMANQQRDQADQGDFQQKLWNHLAHIANYQLDIDYPVEIVREDNISSQHNVVHYPMKDIKYRHYGYLIEQCMKELEEMPEGELRDEYLCRVANQMNQNLYVWNTNSKDDEQVASDIARYTKGQVQLNLEDFKFAPVSASPYQQVAVKKKKTK